VRVADHPGKLGVAEPVVRARYDGATPILDFGQHDGLEDAPPGHGLGVVALNPPRLFRPGHYRRAVRVYARHGRSVRAADREARWGGGRLAPARNAPPGSAPHLCGTLASAARNFASSTYVSPRFCA